MAWDFLKKIVSKDEEKKAPAAPAAAPAQPAAPPAPAPAPVATPPAAPEATPPATRRSPITNSTGAPAVVDDIAEDARPGGAALAAHLLDRFLDDHDGLALDPGFSRYGKWRGVDNRFSREQRRGDCQRRIAADLGLQCDQGDCHSPGGVVYAGSRGP